MGYDIGPRIGIQGEKEFNNQIRAINNSIKECGSEMRALSAKFSENAKGQDALVAKTKVLEKEYDAQKQKSSLLQSQYDKEVKKLQELAKAYQKAIDENGKNSAEAAKAETAFNKQAESVSKLKVAMNETEAYMGKLETSINSNRTALDEMEAGTRDAVTGLSNLEQQADQTGNELEDIGNKLDKGLLMAAGDKIGEMGDKLLDLGNRASESFMSIEDATVKVNARFAETGKEAEASGKLIQSIYEKGIGDSLDGVADAVIVVRDNFKDLDQVEMQNITEQCLKLQDMYGIDLSESVRGANGLMEHFGISATEAMDLIVTGTQGGLDKTQELGDNLAEYSGKFAEAGYSAQEYFQLLQNGMDAGAYNLDKVNDAINEVTTRLGDGTIAENISLFSSRTQELFEKWKNGGATQKDVINSIVEDIGSATSEQEAMNMASAAFGTIAEDGGIKVAAAMTSVGNSYDDVSGKAKEFGENSETSSQKAEAAQRKLEDAMAQFGEKTTDVKIKVADTLSKLAEGFGNLPGPVQSVIVGIGGILAILSLLAPIVTTITGIMTAMGVAGTASAAGTTAAGAAAGASSVGFGALSASLLPIIAIIAGIVLVITLVVAAIKNWDAIVEWFKTNAGDKLKAVGEFFGNLGKKIGEMKDQAVEKIKSLKDGAVQKFEELKSGAGEKIEGLKNLASEKLSAMKKSYDDAGGGFKGAMAGAMTGIQGIFSTGFNVLNSMTGGKLGEVRNKFKSGIDGAKDAVHSGIEKIKGIFSKLKLKLPEIKIPKIKLPHFSISGGFSLSPPKIPKISVSWYKKGGILSGAQIFGRMGNTLLGGGEAGKEAVLPLSGFYDKLGSILKGFSKEEKDYSGTLKVNFSPNIKVMVGNEEFDAYIIDTAENGITGRNVDLRKARGL